MLTHLCTFLVATHVLATATTASPNCSGTTEQPVAVEGWPVLVALRMPVMATVTLNLSLSAGGDVHTNLTLTHEKQEGKDVGMVDAKLYTRMARDPLHTAALLLDSQWATLRLTKGPKELKMRVDSEAESSRYSTTALLRTMSHLHVDTVFCSGSNCNLMDLQCYRITPDTGKSNHTTAGNPIPSTSSNREAYYWVFYAVITLLVIACLLFFVWRNERNKFRARWQRHSLAVRDAASSIMDQERSMPDTGVTSNAVEWRADKNDGHCSFAYDGPCRGDSN